MTDEVRRVPVLDGVELCGVHVDKAMTRRSTLKYLEINHVPVSEKDSTSLLVVQFQVVFSVNAQILHVDLEPFFGNHVSKDMVHKHLKCWWSIAETKNMTVSSKRPKGVINAAFHWSSS